MTAAAAWPVLSSAATLYWLTWGPSMPPLKSPSTCSTRTCVFYFYFLTFNLFTLYSLSTLGKLWKNLFKKWKQERQKKPVFPLAPAPLDTRREVIIGFDWWRYLAFFQKREREELFAARLPRVGGGCSLAGRESLEREEKRMKRWLW